jgi:hypothetical protein
MNLNSKWLFDLKKSSRSKFTRPKKFLGYDFQLVLKYILYQFKEVIEEFQFITPV